MTVRRIATNETYTGITYSGKTQRTGRSQVTTRPREEWFLLPDITPPIITEEMFGQAQEMILQKKLEHPIKQNSPYLLTGFMRCSKCGSPIGGTTLNHKYRYYQCRGARPTASRGKICDAGYIKADHLEEEVWRQVIVMMTSPNTILRKLTDKDQQKPDNIALQLTKQIDQVRKKIKSYTSREKNLYDLMSHESVTKEYVLESISKLRQDRVSDERLLKSLIEQRRDTSRSKNLSLQLSEYSMNEMASLFFDHEYRTFDVAYSDYGEPSLIPVSPAEIHVKRRQFLESLKLKVLADPKNFSFNFTLHGNLISSTQQDEFSSFEKELRKFEEENTSVTIGDLLDPKKRLAENTPFVQKVNQLKQNLVTIEQTWA